MGSTGPCCILGKKKRTENLAQATNRRTLGLHGLLSQTKSNYQNVSKYLKYTYLENLDISLTLVHFLERLLYALHTVDWTFGLTFYKPLGLKINAT